MPNDATTRRLVSAKTPFRFQYGNARGGLILERDRLTLHLALPPRTQRHSAARVQAWTDRLVPCLRASLPCQDVRVDFLRMFEPTDLPYCVRVFQPGLHLRGDPAVWGETLLKRLLAGGLPPG